MTIEEIRKKYADGDIDVKSYALQMFKKYEELFCYQELLEKSKVKEIIIREKEILYKIRLDSPFEDCNEYEILMEMYKKDCAAVPNTILSIGEYEPLELDMVGRIVSYMNEGIFFDIGANLGWYTLNMKKQYPDLKVYAFEPIEDNYNKVKKNLEWNDLNQVKVFNIGLYHENTTLRFYYDVCASGASSLENLRGDEETREVMCKVERLDDVVKEQNISAMDFVKCDVEGAELFVYKGGFESIKKFKPVIFSEILRKWSAKFGYHPNDIIDLLAEAGYQCYVIKEKGKLRKFGRVNEQTLETNYFFMHVDKHAQIIRDLVEE